MTEFFRFTIELKAQIHNSPMGDRQKNIYERVQRLAKKMIMDKNRIKEVYKIIFLELLLGDYYSDTLRRKLKLKKENEIILPVSKGLQPQDAAFFSELFKEPLSENLSLQKDNALNLLFSQFGTPEIIDTHLEFYNTRTANKNKNNK